MYIIDGELPHLGISANLSREETFSRSQQQNNAILMNWQRRKASLILKYDVGVTRKLLNGLKSLSYVYEPRDIDPATLTGRIKLDEVTVFKVTIDGHVKEVVTRLFTTGEVMFQFLDIGSSKIRIAACGRRSAHVSMPVPFLSKIVEYSRQDETYRKLMLSILDHLINHQD
jgi:hypothetical protein